MQVNDFKFTGSVIACFIICLVGLFGIASYAKTGGTVSFVNGVKDYQEGNYQAASEKFLKIVQNGTRNGKLFYNLGNAYLKQKNLGKAILWYERAHQLMPRDPDIAFNLEYARGMVKDKAEEKTSPLIKSIFFWNYLFSFSEIIRASIVCVLLFWMIACLRRIYHKRFTAPGISIFYYVLMSVSILLVLTCFYNYYQTAYVREAVILPERIPVRSGLSDTATELFVLHAGSRVRIQSEKDDYVKIYFSSGKLGWIKRSAVGIINPSPP